MTKTSCRPDEASVVFACRSTANRSLSILRLSLWNCILNRDIFLSVAIPKLACQRVSPRDYINPKGPPFLVLFGVSCALTKKYPKTYPKLPLPTFCKCVFKLNIELLGTVGLGRLR